MDNFLLKSVYASSHSALPLYYKITAIWTTNQGSMLLWNLCLAAYLLLLHYQSKESEIANTAITIQSYIGAVFLLFIIYAANPFEMFAFKTDEGAGLNPILQDVALTIHPPILYMGYLGCSVCFSIVIAMLITEKTGKKELTILKQFLLLAFGFLTAGILLGSWWSYRELGWGGFWGWDPIENASLMPWILLLCGLHCSFVPQLKKLGLFAVMLSFIAVIFATMVTRGGLVQSIHTFNTDTESILYLSIILILLTTGSVTVFFTKIGRIDITTQTRNGSIFISIHFWVGMILFFLLLISTTFPIAWSYFFKEQAYISQDLYNMTFAQAGVILSFSLILYLFGKASLQKALTLILYCFIGVILSDFSYPLTAVLNITGVTLTLMILEKCIYGIIKSPSVKGVAINITSPFFLSHLGFGLLLCAIACFHCGSQEEKKYFLPGDILKIHNYQIQLKEYQKINNQLFSAIRGVFLLNQNTVLTPEFRFYKVEKSINTEVATKHLLLDDLQIVISGIDDNLGLATEIYYKSNIQLIWLSTILIIMGIVSSYLGRYLNCKN